MCWDYIVKVYARCLDLCDKIMDKNRQSKMSVYFFDLLSVKLQMRLPLALKTKSHTHTHIRHNHSIAFDLHITRILVIKMILFFCHKDEVQRTSHIESVPEEE